jgi:hypothetical protein
MDVKTGAHNKSGLSENYCVYQAQVFVNHHIGQSSTEHQDKDDNVYLQEKRFTQVCVPKNNNSNWLY